MPWACLASQLLPVFFAVRTHLLHQPEARVAFIRPMQYSAKKNPSFVFASENPLSCESAGFHDY